MQYSLRTLLIVLALGPPMLALVCFKIMVHLTSYPPRVKTYDDSNGQTGLRPLVEGGGAADSLDR